MKIVIKNAHTDSKIAGMMRELGMDVEEVLTAYRLFPVADALDHCITPIIQKNRGPVRNIKKGKRRLY